MAAKLYCTFGCNAEKTTTYLDDRGKRVEVCPDCIWLTKRRDYKLAPPLEIVVSEMTINDEFMLCEACQDKTERCLGCVHNRTLISMLQQALKDREVSRG